MNNVYTYYDNFDPEHDEENRQLIRLWKRSWAKQGWNPQVLSKSDAKQHPLFSVACDRLLRLPTSNRIEYELSCYYRWLAVAHRGGGFMSDFDVVNYEFRPEVPASPLVIYECVSAADSDQITPSVVGGSAYGFMNAFCSFALPEPDDMCVISRGQKHVSDMIALQAYRDTSLYTLRPIVRQYGQTEDWEKAPLVHYSHMSTEHTDRIPCAYTARPI